MEASKSDLIVRSPAPKLKTFELPLQDPRGHDEGKDP
jgi:hypothetical protein